MPRLDLVILSGSKLRHLYFALELSKKFSNSRIILQVPREKEWNRPQSKVIDEHLGRLEETEVSYFGEYIDRQRSLLTEKVITRMAPKEVNSDRIFNLLAELNPRFIAVHSTSLIGARLIQRFPRRLINLHAGLSPYYRGSGTNVFPFLNRELQYVGMTIHFIDEGIDSGDIIHQGRPVFEQGDNTHMVGCKNVILGTKLMIEVLDALLSGVEVKGQHQNIELGRLYYERDFTDDVVIEVNRVIDEGLVRNYLKNPVDIPIVTLERVKLESSGSSV